MNDDTSSRRYINKSCFITMFILTIIHIFIVGYTFYVFDLYNIFIYISMWSFLICSIYLIAILIVDSNLIFSNSIKLEPINDFFRNFFAGIAYPFCYSITLTHWCSKIITFLGSSTGSENEETTIKFLLRLYYYLFTAIIMTLDLFFTKRKNNFFGLMEFLGNSILYFIYEIVICIDKYEYGNHAYDYMVAISAAEMIIHGVVNYAILIACYFLYILLKKAFNKNNLITLSKEERQSLMSNGADESNL